MRFQVAKHPMQNNAAQEESGALNADRYSSYSEEITALIDGRPN